MSSMVGGNDLVFETTRHKFDVRLLLDTILELWPDALFQDAEADATRPLMELLGDPTEITAREFFLYKDPISAESWERDGWTEEHGDDMVHLLINDDASRTDVLQLTLVVDSLNGAMQRLIGAVHDVFGRMSLGERSRSRRVNWEVELRAADFSLGREQFYEKVEELRAALYADWTADELACHPHEALQFCEAVRRRVDAPVPDHLVMKALMNYRRQGRKMAM